MADRAQDTTILSPRLKPSKNQKIDLKDNIVVSGLPKCS